MADYVVLGRSNYFKVKSREEFEIFCRRFDLNPIEDDSERVGFYFEWVNQTFPVFLEFGEEGEMVETDLLDQISKLLDENQVAIVMEIGHEKVRYLTGRSWAVDSTGRKIVLDLSAIYPAVKKKFGLEATFCEY